MIADDDVRYTPDQLVRLDALLHDHDLVRPQNYFSPLPWHAWWDTGRTLDNRGLGGEDVPGTLAVRRETFTAMGGYDGDVLFENLELIRTVRAHGGQDRNAPDIHVARNPPTTGRFWSRRVRQAYDDHARPARPGAALAVLPGIGCAVASGARASCWSASGRCSPRPSGAAAGPVAPRSSRRWRRSRRRSGRPSGRCAPGRPSACAWSAAASGTPATACRSPPTASASAGRTGGTPPGPRADTPPCLMCPGFPEVC
ncbi:glycosyltransferase [Pilimelia terevasa]|uniref:glycosyltransferase n=1 Tax=Pilimelia terevasa TaxID=53372 RepID=UPI001E5DC36A|nr:hypothetical protein [Pilimelia terevasa]